VSYFLVSHTPRCMPIPAVIQNFWKVNACRSASLVYTNSKPQVALLPAYISEPTGNTTISCDFSSTFCLPACRKLCVQDFNINWQYCYIAIAPVIGCLRSPTMHCLPLVYRLTQSILFLHSMYCFRCLICIISKFNASSSRGISSFDHTKPDNTESVWTSGFIGSTPSARTWPWVTGSDPYHVTKLCQICSLVHCLFQTGILWPSELNRQLYFIPCSHGGTVRRTVRVWVRVSVCPSFSPKLCPSDNFPDANPDPTLDRPLDRPSDGPNFRSFFSLTFSRRD
jgi:hypothetical protein